MKKIHILVLAVIMAVSVMPAAVFAGEISDGADDGVRAVSAATDDHTCQGRIKAATNDRLKIEVYSGRKKVKTSTFYSSTESLTLRSAGKWKKGTYHIRVYRGNSRSSGWYSLK